MRSPLGVTVLLLCLLLCSAGVYAQSDGPTFYLGGGVGLPISPDDFSDYYNMGYTFGAGAGMPLGESGKFSALGFFEYNRFGINKDQLIADSGFPAVNISIDGGTATVLSFMGGGKMSLGSDSQAIPYLTAGVGYFRFSLSDATVSGGGQSLTVSGVTENKFGLSAGAGVDISLGDRTGAFIEARYNVGFTANEKTHYLPIRVGLSFR